MSCRRRARSLAALVIAAALNLPNVVSAQDSTSTHPDSLAQRAQWASNPDVVPTAALQVPAGPLPPGSRYTFTRDSLIWTSAVTLADLLASVPGVYLARGGFLGLPEYVVYGGRGAATLEIFWDGHELEAMGGDSVYIDPGRIGLTYLRRVEVEMWPSLLKVYLISERHESLRTRSVVRIVTGDFGTGVYGGLFQKRWGSGTALTLAGNFVGTDGASGPSRSDQTLDLWGKFEWLPSPTTGMSYQVRRQQLDRDSVTPPTGLLEQVGLEPLTDFLGIPERKGVRTDYLFTFFSTSSPGRFGLHTEVGIGASSWSNDSLATDSLLEDQQIRQAFLQLRYTRRRFSLQMRGRVRDARTKGEVEGRIGWIPVIGVLLSGDAGWRRHPGDRTSQRAHGAMSLYRGPVSVVGEIALQDEVQAPALLADTAQRTVDLALRASLLTRPLSGHVSLVRRDAYLPMAFPEFLVIPAFDTSSQTTHVLAGFKFQPVRPLTLDGWYANPLSGAVDFQPPKHGRAQLTFRSKFWPTFRSGGFDLKIQLAMDFWSHGTAGLDATGEPIELRGLTFYETYVEFQIVGFTAFWDLRNAYNCRCSYVPGLEYPRTAQTYGVRWQFID